MYVLVDTSNPNATHTFETIDALKEWLEPSVKVDKTAEILLTIKELLESIGVSKNATLPSTPLSALPSVSPSAPSSTSEIISSFSNTTTFENFSDTISKEEEFINKQLIHRSTRRDDPKTVGYVKKHESTVDIQFNNNQYEQYSKHNIYTTQLPQKSKEYVDMVVKLKDIFTKECLIQYKSEQFSPNNICSAKRVDTTCITMCLKLWILHPDLFPSTNRPHDIKGWASMYETDIINDTTLFRIFDKYYLYTEMFKGYFNIIDAFDTWLLNSTNNQNTLELLHHYYKSSLNHTHIEMFIRQYVGRRVSRNEKTAIQSSILYDSFMEWFQSTYTELFTNIKHSNKLSLFDEIIGFFTNKRFTTMFEQITGYTTIRKTFGIFWQGIEFMKDTVNYPNRPNKDAVLYESTDDTVCPANSDCIYEPFS